MDEDRFRPPVSVGEELDVKIEAVGAKGDGIAKKQGFVLFVPNTKEGDNVKVRITKVLRKMGFAEVIGASSGKAESDEQPGQSEEPAQDSDDFGETPDQEVEEEAPEEESAEEESAEE